MRIRFIATAQLVEYHGVRGGIPLDMKDGDIREVPEDAARGLLTDFPANFETLGEPHDEGMTAPPLDKMFRRGKKK